MGGLILLRARVPVESAENDDRPAPLPQPPDAQTLYNLLQGSSQRWLARDGANGPVLGFVTAISDGVLSAYIPLLEVLPSFQGQGLGRELVRRMLASLGHLQPCRRAPAQRPGRRRGRRQ